MSAVARCALATAVPLAVFGGAADAQTTEAAPTAQTPTVAPEPAAETPVASTTAATGAPPAPTSAAGSDDIIVTATRREERLKDVPISVTAITEAELRRTGTTGTRELGIITPGLQVNTTGGGAQPTIRGVGNILTSGGFESPVAIYIDGVYVSAPFASAFDLINAESIQVLKGPQGTLFGRNATGGAILVTTKRPSQEFTGDFLATYGRFDDVKLAGYVSGPLAPSLSFSIAGLYHDDNGYSRDALRGTHLSDYNEKNVRGRLLFEPSSDTSIELLGDYGVVRDSVGSTVHPLRQTAPAGGFLTNPREVAFSFDPFSRVKIGGGSLQIKQDLGGVTVKSITAYRDLRYFTISDQDRTPAAVSRVDQRVDEHYLTQEVTLASSAPGPFQWVAGAFYYDDKARSPTFSNGTLLVDPRFPTKSYSAFGEATYAITDALKLTAGLRYTYERRVANFTRPFTSAALPTTARRVATADGWTPRFSVLYALDPSSNIYATYSKGFKSGFFNGLPFGGDPIAPERIESYEVGYKRAGQGITVSAAAFYSNYSDLQLTSRTPAGLSITVNAANAKIYGGEADVGIRVTDGFRLRFGGAYTHSEYRNFVNAPFYIPLPAGGNRLVQNDASGNPLIRTPKWTGLAQANYETELGGGKLNASASFYYNSGFAWTPDNRVREPDYVIVNGEIGWSPDDHYRIAIWGKNLTNDLYGLGASVSASADAIAYARPRSYGISAEYKF